MSAGRKSPDPVRDATAADLDAVARVAAAVGQGGEWSASDPAYVQHLMRHGRFVVVERDGVLCGYAAARAVTTPVGEVSMLCDLFVDPAHPGEGLGRRLLEKLWPAGGGARMTFSSLHEHAMPLYLRAGLAAWWPLLYLRGRVDALPGRPGWAVEPADPTEVAALELGWTGADRRDDHAAWAARPGGGSLVVRRAGAVVAAGTAAGVGADFGVTHLAGRPAMTAEGAVGALLAALASRPTPAPEALVTLPGPHPAVPVLLAAGWRIDTMDVFMATDPAAVDPVRSVPSPALA